MDPLRGGYRGTIIHFGGRFKSIEEEWVEWLAKYEALLGRLYWESSTAHLDTELAGAFRLDWWVENWSSHLALPPRPPATWAFRGPFRRWGEST